MHIYNVLNILQLFGCISETLLYLQCTVKIVGVVMGLLLVYT